MTGPSGSAERPPPSGRVAEQKRAPVAEATEATQATEATEATEATQATEPAEPAEAAEPAEPAEPAEAVASARAARAALAAEAAEELAVAQALALVGPPAPSAPTAAAAAATSSTTGPASAGASTTATTTASASGDDPDPGHGRRQPPAQAHAAPDRGERLPAHSPEHSPTPAPAPAPTPAPGRHSAQGRRHVRPTSWGEARALAARAGRAVPPRSVRLPLDRALGQVLAEPLTALTDLPSFDTSAMDGWAVAGPGPWTIRADEGILAGHATPAPLPDGDAIRIATGARIPSDVTAVIRSEHAHADEAKGLLHAQRQVHPGQDIRPRGQECRSGDQLLPAGTLVTPAVLGLAAAAGYDELTARPRPRVDVLVLGDELLTAGLPHDGLIRDALGPMIGPWLRALGAEVAAPRRLGDDAEALRQALTGSRADLIITTGGTAAGPVDHVHPVLDRIGAELLVDGVAVRPGHPMLLARLAAGGPYLVGLPGNPLAAVSGLLTLAEPLLGGLAGRTPQDRYRIAIRDEVHGHPHDTRLVPVVHRTADRPGGVPGAPTRRDGSGTGGGTDHVVPLHYNGPAMLRGIAAADGLAVVEPGGVRSGTEVEILDLPWAPATPWTEGCFT